jgi:hypothetical protein
VAWAGTIAESPFAGGIRSATVHDFADGSGQPRFSADHPVLSDRAECDRLSYHTDGQWIWRLSTAYYLAEYGIAPHRDLLAHLRAMERGAG